MEAQTSSRYPRISGGGQPRHGSRGREWKQQDAKTEKKGAESATCYEWRCEFLQLCLWQKGTRDNAATSNVAASWADELFPEQDKKDSRPMTTQRPTTGIPLSPLVVAEVQTSDRCGSSTISGALKVSGGGGGWQDWVQSRSIICCLE